MQMKNSKEVRRYIRFLKRNKAPLRYLVDVILKCKSDRIEGDNNKLINILVDSMRNRNKKEKGHRWTEDTYMFYSSIMNRGGPTLA